MSPSLSKRLFLAHMELNYRLNRKVTLAELGEMIAHQMGRESAFTAAAVSRWENGTQVPAPEVIEAIAALTHTDPGWISHGDKTAAPSPRGTSGSAGNVEPTHAPQRPTTPEPEGSRIRKRRRS
jgi:transcriptional regulator with XRE-family HTH domain